MSSQASRAASLVSGQNRVANLMSGQNWKTLLLILFAAAGTALLNDSYYIDVLVSIGIIFIMIMAMDLVIGYMGQISLGHNGFFAVGAYLSGVLTLRLGISPWFAMVIGIATNAFFAFLLSFIVFRTRHMYLAIMTLSFGVIISSLTIALYDITEGTLGLSGVEPLAFGDLSINTGLRASILVWLVAAIVFWLCLNIVNSRVGRALRAIHTDESGASAMGVDLMKYKAKIFILSAVLASVAGSLYVHYRGGVTPGTIGTTMMAETLLMLFLGGAGTLWGGLLGTSLLKVLPQLGNIFQDYKTLVYAIMFVVILLFFPRGLVGLFPIIARRLESIWRSVFPRTSRSGQDVVANSGVKPIVSSYGEPLKGNGRNDVIELSNLDRYFGGLLAVGDLSFTVPQGRIQSLIGPNGAGKSTVLNLINGFFLPSRGEIRIEGRLINGLGPHEIATLGVGRTFQVPRLFDNLTLLENVMVGHHTRTKTEIFQAAFSLPSARVEEAAVREDSLHWLSMVGLDHHASAFPPQLSHGQKRWLELARVLACRPRVILLDEPTSGLNETEKQQFREFLLVLRSTGITTLLVEHDMNFVMTISDFIVVMNYGKKLAQGLPKEVQQNEEVVRAYLG